MPSQKNTTAQSASSGTAQTTVNSNSVSQRTKTALIKANLKKFWWLLPLLGLILTIGGISVMRLLPRTKSETQSSTNYLAVAVTEVSLEPLKAWIPSQGTVQAVKLKHLTFDVEGEVTYIAKRASGRTLRAGDRVKSGELLAQVDDRKAVADVNKALAGIVEAQKDKSADAAAVAQAQAQVAQAQSQVREKQAQVETSLSALNLAQTQMNRYQQIYQQGVISADDFDIRSVAVDKAKAELKAAQAGVVSAEKEVESAQTQVQAAQDRLEAAESGIVNARALLTQARVALEGSRLYAPFNGVVAYINIRKDETFDPQIVNSQLGGDYQGILDRVPIVIVDPSLLEVHIDLAAENSEQVRPGQTAVVADKSNPEIEANNNDRISMKAVKAKGRVFAVNPVVSPGTRSIPATIRISEGGMRLQHGERVTTWIAIAGKPSTLVAPLNAFVFRNQKPYIFVVNPKKGIVEERLVKVGIKGISKREILNGVKAGESIVVEGQNRLVDGTPVKIVRKVNYPSPSLPEIFNDDE